MLLLVIADRNDVRIVQENIRRHQNRISQKSRADRFLALTLCLELRHAEQLACVRAAVQNPAKLRVSRHLRLHEDDGFFRIDADSQIECRDVQNVLLEHLRLLRYGDRVFIYDAVDAFVILLQLHELLERPKIVS